MAELRCEDVTKSYGNRSVLSELDLHVPEGTLTAILGASGSGKTTLLRVIMGFLRLDSGRILVGGTVVAEGTRSHVAPEKRGVGYVAQEGALYPHLSVGENVGFGLPRPQRKGSKRIDDVLELVGLSPEYSKRRVHELSGGEQRRVALARALAPRPRLVLLDEPFSALDAGLRVETREAVLSALLEERTTAVLVTHDQAEAMSMGSEVAVLRDGRLVQTAAPSTLYRTPSDLEVARFVGDAVVLPGRAASGWVTCPLGNLETINDPVDGPVNVVIRPEQIRWRRCQAQQEPAMASSPAVTATVTGRAYYGPDVVLRLALDGNGLTVNAKTFSHDSPQIGEVVELDVSGAVLGFARPGGDDCSDAPTAG